jgi:rubredoxin
MKIVKKVKLPKVVCALCGCVYRPEKGDFNRFSIKGNTLSIEGIRSDVSVNCPVCGLVAYPFAKEGQGDE